MKKWKISVLLLTCVAFLFSPKEALANGEKSSVSGGLDELLSPKDEFLFEDGDVVGFIGDSITHVEYTEISYQEFLYNYYITRYPGWDLEFRNLGTGSFTAEDVLELYRGEKDIYDAELEGLTKAVIMLGMNEALTGVDAKEYSRNIRAARQAPPVLKRTLYQTGFSSVENSGSMPWAFTAVSTNRTVRSM